MDVNISEELKKLMKLSRILKNRKNKGKEISFDIMTGFMINYFPLIIC